MKRATVRTQVSRIAEFNVFGKTFEYELASNDKGSNLDPKLIVGILSRQIIEVTNEWGRNDGKKVILFYEKSDLYGHMRYKFSVEEDKTLSELMKTRYENPHHISQMISYMYENHDKLNFI